MTRINLLWPRWASRAAKVTNKEYERRKSVRLWGIIRRAAELHVDAVHRAQKADLVRRVFSVVVLTLVLAGVASADEPTEDAGALYRALGVGAVVAKGGDLLSTEYVLAVGGVERNPLVRDRRVRLAAGVVAPFAVNWFSERVRRAGHPRIALWMRIAYVAAHAWVIQHNLRIDAS